MVVGMSPRTAVDDVGRACAVCGTAAGVDSPELLTGTFEPIPVRSPSVGVAIEFAGSIIMPMILDRKWQTVFSPI